MHDLWPTLLYYLSVMAIVGATPSPPHPWRTGAVCEDANYSMPSSDLLRGKHLRVLELHWPPFAIRPNATKPNWTGYDIDLLHKVQEHLGFTFQVVDTQDRFPDETWEVYLERWMNHGDIMLSFWARSPERMRHWIQLNGHVDMATVLIARTYRGDAGADVLTWSAIFKCFHPFSWELWTCLLLMVVFSGFIDYVLEGWSDGGRIGTSLYEYAAGSLWGGFEYPRSRSSAIYQIFVGFILLVTSSTYTANLAAYITNSGRSSTVSAGSIADVITHSKPVCMTPGHWAERIEALYPTLVFHTSTYATNAFDRLSSPHDFPDYECDAVIATRNMYDGTRTDLKYCNLLDVESLAPSMGGWMTNRQSSCVQHAMEWALQTLIDVGDNQRLYLKWAPPTRGCYTGENGEAAAARAGGRRLSSSVLSHELAPDRHSLRSSAASARRLARAAGEPVRRLSSSGGGGGAAVGAVGAATDEEDGIGGQAQLFDFLGLFILWGSCTIFVVSCTLLGPHLVALECTKRLHLLLFNCSPFLTAAILGTPESLKKTARTRDAMISRASQRNPLADFGIGSINLDNEGAMLREVLLQLAMMRKHLETSDNARSAPHESERADPQEEAVGGPSVSFGFKPPRASCVKAASVMGAPRPQSAFAQQWLKPGPPLGPPPPDAELHSGWPERAHRADHKKARASVSRSLRSSLKGQRYATLTDAHGQGTECASTSTQSSYVANWRPSRTESERAEESSSLRGSYTAEPHHQAGGSDRVDCGPCGGSTIVEERSSEFSSLSSSSALANPKSPAALDGRSSTSDSLQSSEWA